MAGDVLGVGFTELVEAGTVEAPEEVGQHERLQHVPVTSAASAGGGQRRRARMARQRPQRARRPRRPNQEGQERVAGRERAVEIERGDRASGGSGTLAGLGTWFHGVAGA